MKLSKFLRFSLTLVTTGFLSGLSVAQTLSTDASKVSSDMHNAFVAALSQQVPGLGMRVLAIEDGQHVLAGGNGRYIIKGVLQDLWNGVERTGSVKETLPLLPPLFKPERFFVSLGNPKGEQVKIFIKSNCKMCDSVFAVLKSPVYLDKYQFDVMVLGNDDQSEAAARFVYCSTTPEYALESLLTNPLRNFDNNPECDVDTPKLSTKAAMAMNIRALPMTHFTQRSLSVVGDPSGEL